MSRILLFAFLFACLVYILQASPVPDDAPSTSPPSVDLDDIMSKAKKALDSASDAISKGNLDMALDKAKALFENAGENIKKEVEKIVDKLRD